MLARGTSQTRAHAGLSCFQIIAHASSFQPLPSFKYLYRAEQLLTLGYEYSKKMFRRRVNTKRRIQSQVLRHHAYF